LHGRPFFTGLWCNGNTADFDSAFFGSNPNRSAICGSSSIGRASPCQGERREFESLLPLQFILNIFMNIIIVLAVIGLVVTLVALRTKRVEEKKKAVNNSQVNPPPTPGDDDDTSNYDPIKRK
jgi:hypothetical protein